MQTKRLRFAGSMVWRGDAGKWLMKESGKIASEDEEMRIRDSTRLNPCTTNMRIGSKEKEVKCYGRREESEKE